MLENAKADRVSLSHGLRGVIDPAAGDVRQYVVFVDLDDDPSTGGEPSELGFATAFRGAELVTRVEVRLVVIGAIGGVYAQASIGPALRANPTVWRWDGAGFVEVEDPDIRASAIAPTGGEVPTAQFSVVAIQMPTDVRGPAASSARIQAIAELVEPRGELDRLPDDRDGGERVILEPPLFPVCGVTPTTVPRTGTATVEATGLTPGATAKILLGEELVTSAPIDRSGNVTTTFTVPAGAKAGRRLVTVGVAGTALTADCDVTVPDADHQVSRYQYAGKIVCGIQPDPRSLTLVRGQYATTVNIHNPTDERVVIRKRLALTVPPGAERPGRVIPIAEEVVGPEQAIAVECDDVLSRVAEAEGRSRFIEGFIVIESTGSLDVTAVYTTATLNSEGSAENHSSIHVEPVAERIIDVAAPDPGRADLVVRGLDLLDVDCPGGACVTTVEVTVANVGTGDAGPFVTRTIMDPEGAVIVDTPLPGLAAGVADTFVVVSPPGGNCYDPNCTAVVNADALDAVAESDETNNTAQDTWLG